MSRSCKSTLRPRLFHRSSMLTFSQEHSQCEQEARQSPACLPLPHHIDPTQNAMTKLDSILAENPGKSLDELLASRKINADQKAQASKKPALQASLAQLEEQIAQYKKIDADYQSRMSAQHSHLTSSHQAEIEKMKADLTGQLEDQLNSALRQKLLTFSQFLRAAAAKRVIEEEADSDESKAFEGALLLVYGGDDKAVDAVMNLITGSDEQVPSVEGELLPVKCKKIQPLTDGLDADIAVDSQIKAAAVGFGAFPGEETAQEEAPTESTDAPAVQPEDPSSDPTIAHAGLTELNQPAEEEKPIVAAEDLPIAEASIDDSSANKSAETQWDNAAATAGNDEQLDDSFEMVPRPADETEAVHEPAQPQSTSSWADQTSANATATEAAAESNNITNGLASTDAEGYQSVERRGGRGGQGRGGRGGHGRGRGGPRGGPRGNFRGRGDGQGRGRGGRGGAPQPQA
jgi:hypothetical protein